MKYFEDTPELPGWALRKTFLNELARNQQVLTLDGTKCGNGMIIDVYLRGYSWDDPHTQHLTIVVVTEAGSIMTLNEKELHEYFSLGEFIMVTPPTTEAKAAIREHFRSYWESYTCDRMRIRNSL